MLAGLTSVGMAAGALGSGVFYSSASAQLRTLTVTLLGGVRVTVTVDVPPGTPLDQIKLPGINLPILSVTDGTPGPGAPSAPGVTVGPATPPSAPAAGPGAPQSSSAAPSAAAPASGGRPSARPGSGRRQRSSGHASLPQGAGGGAASDPGKPGHPRLANPLRLPGGLPSFLNPSLSLVLPGAASVGVPDFFIDRFRIPPFLLPIYQAAGTQYQVPWQVLAAINEIETNYGRDLSTSTAGAMGWMQFLPVEWRQYGVDATGTGVKDPFNPADAIFAAARYLHAAGASSNLRGAIFAYNHANWYVDSVLLRAKLIGGVPPQLLGAITGLTEGHFPVHARARYADDLTEHKINVRRAKAHNASVADDPSLGRKGINIYARQGAPVIAAQDGQVLQLGESPKLGRYLMLRDAYGNTYTYSQLGSVVREYPVPKPLSETAAQIARDLHKPVKPADPAPSGPASAGYQAPPAPVAAVGGLLKSTLGAITPPASGQISQAPTVTPVDTSGSTPKERLFANPTRPEAKKAGALDTLAQASPGLPGYQTFDAYFTQVFGLSRTDVTMKPLRAGSRVVAGTILGRIGQTTGSPHMLFQIRPAGRGSPLVDPKPILDGWVLLERTSIYRAKGANPFVGQNPTIGQVLLESKEQLQQQVLADPNITIYQCGRRDIAAGQIDQRILATLEFLSASGLKPSVSALKCGHTTSAVDSLDLARQTGNSVDITAINQIPVVGHQGPGSVTDVAIQRLLTLQGNYKPHQITSQTAVRGADNTIALPDHPDRVNIAYLPRYGTNPKQTKQIDATLQPNQWIKLITRLGQIANPSVPATK